jgi:glucosyl-3-phosphoglycerate synthase
MGNFYQNGVITTLHNLTRRPLEDLERELEQFSKRRAMSLVLPSLFSELEGPALGPIIDELTKVSYLGEIVIGLDRADENQFHHAKEYFSRLPQHHRILWNDGPRLRSIDKMLADKGLAPTEMGKGRNVWYCYGYILASGRAKAIALHDCDIVTYNRELLARLLYPVANPSFNYQFCKGYYSRIADGKLNGRACRLLVTPLLKSLQKVFGHNEYLEYMDSFRYALSGEFSMRVDVLNDLRIPSDWGLEIGVISEMYRNYASNRICQVSIAETYDHKHQELSADDPSGGLSRMSTDIIKAVVRKLATQGQVFSLERFRTLKATYYRTALDFIEAYYNDALINGLSLDRHKEEKTVELFAENIMRAGEIFLSNPMETPFMPSWNRVISAIPDILDHLYEAVEADNSDLVG